MLGHHQKFVIAIMLVILHIVAVCGPSYAEGLEVKIVVSPGTEVYIGSVPVSLTAKAQGRNLTYTWELVGRGKIDGKGASVLYILPENIKGDSEVAYITVTVQNESGEEAVESIVLTIVPKDNNNSIIPKIVLGVGAAAAVGAAIALMDGNGGSGDGQGELNCIATGRYAFEQEMSCGRDRPTEGYTTISGGDGTFQFYGGEQGRWHVTLRCTGSNTASVSISLNNYCEDRTDLPVGTILPHYTTATSTTTINNNVIRIYPYRISWECYGGDPVGCLDTESWTLTPQ